jgi:geranylgeranyl diphosphate synthase type II
VAKKTCCYTTVAPLRLGALIGSRGTAPLDALSRFGFHLGAAFQIRDDLLSLEGGAGKDALGDIREGKRTLMLLHLLGALEDRAWLVEFLGRDGRSSADVARVRALMDAHESLDYAREYAIGLAAAAAEALDEALADVPDSPHADFIRGLVPYMLARSA